MGVHQKIDRVARKHLNILAADDNFPSYQQIVHFEGKNGPDGIKRKSPAVDEPWHFINPNEAESSPLLAVIEEHLENLRKSLPDNQQRAAFEAAWLSHAIVDGLTPAHHFPLEETLTELRGGKGLDSRTSILKKNLMTGENTFETLKNNWKFWGAKGAMTMHGGFELGIASVIANRKFSTSLPSTEEIDLVDTIGFRKYFIRNVKQVANLNMYEEFAKSGWTTQLAIKTNRELMPIIIKTVTIAWIVASKNRPKRSK